jgi:hypothetical protein
MTWTGNTSLSRSGNEYIRERASAFGRDADSLGFAALVWDNGAGLEAAIRAWQEAGGTHATVSPIPGRVHAELGATDAYPAGRQMVDQLARLREEVGDAIPS